MTPNKKALTYWLSQILFWSAQAGFVLLFVLQYRPEGRPAWKYWIIFALLAAFAILCTHLIRGYIRRQNWLAQPAKRVIPKSLLASVIIGIVITIPEIALWFLFFGKDVGPEVLNWLPYALPGWSFDVFVWAGIYFRLKINERVRQLELDKLQLAVVAKEAQLQGLVSQINPHFLFNSLNSLRALIVEDPVKAQAMVNGISSLLRYSLQAGKTQTVPLETELEVVRTYLQLERIRFEERLSIHTDAAPDTLKVPVPIMLLQSLVENSVKHGIEKLTDGGEIRIATHLENGELKIRVTNSGQLAGPAGSMSIGLENSRERLRLLYGWSASLVLRNDGANSVVAEVSLPLQPGEISA
jgi:sensor histidine kinase YesM